MSAALACVLLRPIDDAEREPGEMRADSNRSGLPEREAPCDGAAVLRQALNAVERYWAEVPALPVAADWDDAAIAAELEGLDFAAPMPARMALHWAIERLRREQVHAAHPRYFGLFVPRTAPLAVAGDALVAAFNPQLASWSHSPFAVAVEEHLVRAIGARFGYPAASADGVFTSGASEANRTAVLCALAAWQPAFVEEGVFGLPGRPLIYASAQAHPSVRKALRACGLGDRSLRIVSVDERYAMDVGALEARIASDRAAGGHPLLVVATAGSTASGAVDPLEPLAALARRERLWLHVDAAWAGAAAWLPELSWLFAGIEQADSIAFDPHKWLSMPLGSGMYLTRRGTTLRRVFAAEADYLPRPDPRDPLARSLSCSRRFAGLNLLLSLAVSGWQGCLDAARSRLTLGRELRVALRGAGWRIVNRSVLPLVCFVDARTRGGDDAALIRFLSGELTTRGVAWVSDAGLGGRRTLRACITSSATGPADIRGLVDELGRARQRFP